MPNKVIIIFFFWQEGAVNAVFFAAAAFLPELYIFILYLSICFNLAREK